MCALIAATRSLIGDEQDVGTHWLQFDVITSRSVVNSVARVNGLVMKRRTCDFSICASLCSDASPLTQMIARALGLPEPELAPEFRAIAEASLKSND